MDGHKDYIDAYSQDNEVPLSRKLHDKVTPVTKTYSNSIEHDLYVYVVCVFNKSRILKPLKNQLITVTLMISSSIVPFRVYGSNRFINVSLRGFSAGEM